MVKWLELNWVLVGLVVGYRGDILFCFMFVGIGIVQQVVQVSVGLLILLLMWVWQVCGEKLVLVLNLWVKVFWLLKLQVWLMQVMLLLLCNRCMVIWICSWVSICCGVIWNILWKLCFSLDSEKLVMFSRVCMCMFLVQCVLRWVRVSCSCLYWVFRLFFWFRLWEMLIRFLMVLLISSGCLQVRYQFGLWLVNRCSFIRFLIILLDSMWVFWLIQFVLRLVGQILVVVCLIMFLCVCRFSFCSMVWLMWVYCFWWFLMKNSMFGMVLNRVLMLVGLICMG